MKAIRKDLGAIEYDYKNQAWVLGGVYQSCNHPKEMQCNCYGKQHQGETAKELNQEGV